MGEIDRDMTVDSGVQTHRYNAAIAENRADEDPDPIQFLTEHVEEKSDHHKIDRDSPRLIQEVQDRVDHEPTGCRDEYRRVRGTSRHRSETLKLHLR